MQKGPGWNTEQEQVTQLYFCNCCDEEVVLVAVGRNSDWDIKTLLVWR
jgi:hypothetical protein